VKHFACFHSADHGTEVIERTGYAFSTLLQDVGLDHGVDRGEVIAAVNSLELFNRLNA
jgi:hypothetical protein